MTITVEPPVRAADEPSGLNGMDSQSFGRRMRQLRFAKGLTQKACAARAAVSQGRWSEWEAGNAEPGVTVIPVIAKALGVPVQALFVDPPDDVPKPPMGRPRKPTTDPPKSLPAPRRKGPA